MLYAQSRTVQQVDLPTTSGMVGILPNHVPTLGNLAAGWAIVKENGVDKKFFVSSGSFAVNDDGSVTIAAEEVLNDSDIDLDAARKELANAQAALAAGKNEVEKAEAQIAIDTLEAMLK